MLKDLEPDGLVAGPLAIVLLAGPVEEAFSETLSDAVHEPPRVGGFSGSPVGVNHPPEA